jgi:hypothetical protein
MQIKSKHFRLSVNASPARVPAQSVMGRILTAVAGVVVLATAFVVSVFVFAFVASVVLLVGGYLWWKTRELRRQLQARMQEGQVIEGEVIRDSTSHSR